MASLFLSKAISGSHIPFSSFGKIVLNLSQPPFFCIWRYSARAFLRLLYSRCTGVNICKFSIIWLFCKVLSINFPQSIVNALLEALHCGSIVSASVFPTARCADNSKNASVSSSSSLAISPTSASSDKIILSASLSIAERW